MTAVAAGPCRDGHGTAAAEVQRLARHQIMGLSVQFLLGMAVNLVGQPSEATGAAHAASLVLLSAHVLVSAGMLAGAAMALRAAIRAGGRWRRLVTIGAATITVTILAGILTVITKSNWWSAAMAAGFLASFLSYGSVLVTGQAPAPGRVKGPRPDRRSRGIR